MSEHDQFPDCFGPYLVYSIMTGYEYFKYYNNGEFSTFFDQDKSKWIPSESRSGERSRESGSGGIEGEGRPESAVGGGTFELYFLVEFKETQAAPIFQAEMCEAGFPVHFDPVAVPTRYATMRGGKGVVVGVNVFAIWDKFVSRVELSLPVAASADFDIESLKAVLQQGGKKLLIGVIDDGCPFAAAPFRVNAGGTRVLAVWDQNNKPPVSVVDAAGAPCQFGRSFVFGRAFQRSSVPAGGGALKEVGLDEWMQLHRRPSRSVDEEACYADADFPSLRYRQSHGAHVMDVFAGRVPPSSRVGKMDTGGSYRDPPSWAAGNDPASAADIVFVQFPEYCLRDATGVWLGAYVLAAIHFILLHAGPNKGTHVIINLSYGPTTGPHDGSSLLEWALAALVAVFDGNTGPKLEIVLPAGNAYRAEGHVNFKEGATPSGHVQWTWRLPPENTVLCFTEVWMNTADAGAVTVTLTSPGGTQRIATPQKWGVNTMWCLGVSPTISTQGVVPEVHGDWKIKVAGAPANAEVHAYVARTDPNMNMHTGAKRSFFVDDQWEQTLSATASHTRIGGEFDKRGSLVCRDGTLNGIATGQDPAVHVAGGYVRADGEKSSYSSSGPERGVPPGRTGPDFALPGDESYALGGVRAGGNRSGGVFRLVGTSAAAPQLARFVARRAMGTAIPNPSKVPNNPGEIGKRGKGNLVPP